MKRKRYASASRESRRETKDSVRAGEPKLPEKTSLKNPLTAESFLNAAAQIIVALDDSGRIEYLNESGLRLLGYRASSLLGKDWFETCLPAEERESTRHFFDLIKNSQPFNTATHENYILTSGGERRAILWRNTVLRNKNDKFLGTLSSGEDITERIETEKALRVALAKYKTLFECFPLGIVIADRAGNILEANPAAANILGIPREEQERRSVRGPEWRIIRPDGAPMPAEEYASVRALKEKRLVENVEMGVQRPDGSLVWLSVTAAPLPVENYGVVITYSDISARKEMEEALKASERKYRLLYESMMDGFVRVDMEGRILEYNRAFKELLGYSDAELKALTYMDITPERWRELEADIVKNQILPRGYSDIYEKEYRRKDGAVFPVELRTVLLRGETGNPSGMWAIVRDVTARKRAKEALEISNAELKAALEREKRLAHTDMLTGVNNRRSLYETAAREVEIAARYRQPFSMILFDLDHFKKVNDTFGHTVGDEILAKVAESARAELRSADSIGRYGGEEFIVLLPMTAANQAFPLAERIRESVERIRVPTLQGEASVTISAGIVEIKLDDAQGETVEEMIRRADQTMYAAKQAGRNCVKIAE
jgi:diguanylate cyclase (GGDEF)-like protein/PAS domain S-box-containing protein